MQLDDYKLNMTLKHLFSMHEADAVYYMLYDEGYTSKDIIEYIDWCRKRYEQDLDTDFEEWLDGRIPRITLGFCVTEAGVPISGVLEFPKRHEDMDHGTEYEWYYSLREITDSIMKLKIGETIPFKIRDDRTSVGSVTRLK